MDEVSIVSHYGLSGNVQWLDSFIQKKCLSCGVKWMCVDRTSHTILNINKFSNGAGIGCQSNKKITSSYKHKNFKLMKNKFYIKISHWFSINFDCKRYNCSFITYLLFMQHNGCFLIKFILFCSDLEAEVIQMGLLNFVFAVK